MLEVNDKGKVIYWEWKGNDCPFTCQHVYKRWVNPDYLYQEKLNIQNGKTILMNTIEQ